jgi:hypothetical protein
LHETSSQTTKPQPTNKPTSRVDRVKGERSWNYQTTTHKPNPLPELKEIGARRKSSELKLEIT